MYPLKVRADTTLTEGEWSDEIIVVIDSKLKLFLHVFIQSQRVQNFQNFLETMPLDLPSTGALHTTECLCIS